MMVQSVLYVNPVTGKDALVGSAVAPFKTLTGCGCAPRDERICASLDRRVSTKAALKLLEIYEDRVNIPAYSDVLLSLPYRTVRG